MARYEEKTLNWFICATVLSVAFLILYCPYQLGGRELYWQEGYYAAQAIEMEFMPPMPLAHGVAQNSYPLFPLLASIVYNELGLPIELTLRLISVAAMALVATLVWFAAKKAGGAQAAAVAAAMLISSNIIIEKSMDGYPDMLMLFFLTCGWLTWFTFGAGHGNWNLAWVSSLFFCGLAFYTGGFPAMLYFVLPLVFMRRPLTVWPKLRKPGFFIGLAILAGFVMLWVMPHLIFANTIPFQYVFFEDRSFYGYFEHLIEFPLDVLVRFLPWTFIAWAPFCVAYHPLDKTPIFSRYLRTIILTLFFALWLNPYSEPRDIILLAPALAIMTGINYWLVVRRYGGLMLKVLNILPWVSIISGILIFAFYLVPSDLWTNLAAMSRGLEFKNQTGHFVIGMVGGSIALVSGMLLLFVRRKPPLWIYLLILICGPLLFFWTVSMPYRAQEAQKRTFGTELRKELDRDGASPNEVVYKGEILGLYGECCYMGRKVRKISALEEMSKEKKVVYLISTEFPQLPERNWKNLLPTQTKYRDKRICLWRGEKIDNKERLVK
ncbi:MAG: glycosyltransferase family 39 protein [Victivallaceae bacterium]